MLNTNYYINSSNTSMNYKKNNTLTKKLDIKKIKFIMYTKNLIKSI
jgi:hypothetical protein